MNFSSSANLSTGPAPVQGQVVVDNSAAQLLSGLASGVQSFASSLPRTSTPGPSYADLQQDEGHKEAVRVAKRYEELKASGDNMAAEQFYNKQFSLSQASLGADAAASFRTSIGAMVGKTKALNTRDTELDIEAATAKKNAEQIQAWTFLGKELAADQIQNFGLKPEDLDDDTFLSLGLSYNGKKARVAADQADASLQASHFQNKMNDRKLVSQTVASSLAVDFEARIQATLNTYAIAVRQYPERAKELQLQLEGDLTREQSKLGVQFSQAVAKSGGNIADIDDTLVKSLSDRYKAAIDITRGVYIDESQKTQLSILTNTSAMDTLSKLPEGYARMVYLQSAVRTPLQSALQGAVTATGTGTPNYSQLPVDVLARMQEGAAMSTIGTTIPPREVYSTMAAVYSKAMALQPAEVKLGAARALVNTLQEAFTGSRKVQEVATSPEGVPSLMRNLAVQTSPEIQNEFAQAAAEEGMTPAEVVQQSATAIIRKQIAPSLQLEDPAVIRSLDIQYNGGKFVVRIDPEKYTQATGRVDTVSYYGGRSSNASQDAAINRKLRGTEEFLNNTLKAYVNVSGAEPSDVAEALKVSLEISLRGQ